MIMKTPIGLGAYFAYQVGIWPQLFGAYAKPLGLYGVCAFYFVVFFSFYAFIAGGTNGLKVLNNNITPALTFRFAAVSPLFQLILKQQKRCIPAHIRNIAIPLGRFT
jgi:hypothetical protein